MNLRVRCSNDHVLIVKSSFAGKKIRCPKCKVVVQIPVAQIDPLLDDVSDESKAGNGGLPNDPLADALGMETQIAANTTPTLPAPPSFQRQVAREPQTEKKSLPVALIIGLATGIPLVLLVAAVMLWIAFRSPSRDVAESGSSDASADVALAERNDTGAADVAAKPQPEVVSAESSEVVRKSILAPPPEDEFEVFESLTASTLSDQLAKMEKEDYKGTAENLPRGAIFRSGSIYRDKEHNLTIRYDVVREITRSGEAKSSTWTLEQKKPAYYGKFLALNIVDPRIQGQAARDRVGDISRTGEWRLSHENGNQRARGTYKEGKRHGWFSFFNVEGRPIWQGRYDEDRLVDSWLFAVDDKSLFGELALLIGHKSFITAVTFSSDHKLMATGDAKGKTRIWELAMQKLIAEVDTGDDRPVLGLAFSPTTKQLVIACQHELKDQESRIRFWTYESKSGLLNEGFEFYGRPSLQFVEDGSSLLLLHPRGVAKYDIAKRSITANITGRNTKLFTSSQVSPDRNWLAGISDERLVLFDVATLSEHQVLQEGVCGQPAIVFSPDGRKLLALYAPGSRSSSVAWDLETGQPVTISSHMDGSGAVRAVNRNRLVTWHHSDETNSRLIEVWDNREAWRLVSCFPRVQRNQFRSPRISPDGRFVIAQVFGYGDDSFSGLLLWDLTTSERYRLQGGVGTSSVTDFSPDGRYLVTASHEGVGLLWDLENLSKEDVVELADEPPSSLSIVIEKNGNEVEDIIEGSILRAKVTAPNNKENSVTCLYRIAGEEEWLPAWDGVICNGPLSAGDKQVQVRAMNSTEEEVSATKKIVVSSNLYSRWKMLRVKMLMENVNKNIPRLMFSKTDKLAVCSKSPFGDNPLSIWKMPSFEKLALAEYDPKTPRRGPGGFAAMSPSGAYVAIATTFSGFDKDVSLILLDAENGSTLSRQGIAMRIKGMQFAADDKLLLAGDIIADREGGGRGAVDVVTLLEMPTFKEIHQIKIFVKTPLNLSPSGNHLCSYYRGSKGLSVVDLRDGAEHSSGSLQFDIEHFAILPNGKGMITAEHDRVRLRTFPDVENEPLRTFENCKPSEFLAVSPDSQVFTSMVEYSANVQFRRISDGKLLSLLGLPGDSTDDIIDAHFLDGGRKLLLFTEGGILFVLGEAAITKER